MMCAVFEPISGFETINLPDRTRLSLAACSAKLEMSYEKREKRSVLSNFPIKSNPTHSEIGNRQ
jgi:hypothetical protein